MYACTKQFVSVSTQFLKHIETQKTSMVAVNIVKEKINYRKYNFIRISVNFVYDKCDELQYIHNKATDKMKKTNCD